MGTFRTIDRKSKFEHSKVDKSNIHFNLYHRAAIQISISDNPLKDNVLKVIYTSKSTK